MSPATPEAQLELPLLHRFRIVRQCRISLNQQVEPVPSGAQSRGRSGGGWEYVFLCGQVGEDGADAILGQSVPGTQRVAPNLSCRLRTKEVPPQEAPQFACVSGDRIPRIDEIPPFL